MKKVRNLLLVLLAVALCCTTFALTACDDRNESAHTHTHNYQWIDNGDGMHKQHCSVSGCDKPDINSGSHVWGANNKCSKCNAVKPSGESHTHDYKRKYDDTEHWLQCDVSGCTEKMKDRAVHNVSETNGACSVCGYKASGTENPTIPPAHEHTYSNDWTSAGAAGHYNLATCEHTGEHTAVVPHVYDNETDTTCNDCGYVREVIIQHTHSLSKTEANTATCTTDGNSAYWYCSGCEKYFFDKDGNTEIALADTVINKLNHDIEHHNAQAATCTADGWNAYNICKRDGCDYTTYSVITKLGHDIEHVVEQNPTCVSVGWDAYDYCKREDCDYTTKFEKPATGIHVGGTATCIAKAVCEVCHNEYGEIDANNHNIEHHNGHAATCIADGWNEYDTCKRSGCNYTTKTTISPLGHDYATEFTTDKEPTCTEDGSKSKHCTRCEITMEVTVIPANGHSWNNGEVTKDPNCMETGVKTFTCSVCQDTRTETIAALGHDYATEFTTDKEPTCTENGSKSKHCLRCEVITEVTEIPANGHSWNNGEVTKEPNCTETGVKTFTCSVCQDTRTEVIAARGHTKGEVQQTVNPTCTEQGYMVYACEVCNNEFNADYQSALGHSYDSEWVCIRCGYEYATDGLLYGISQDGTYYTVVGYTGNAVQVVIPAHHNGIPVTAVGVEAFKDNTNISSVFLSTLMQSIGGSAFSGCTVLSSINLQNNITDIGFAALQNTGFASLTIPFVGASKDATEKTHFGYIFGANDSSNNSSYIPTSLKSVKITGGERIANFAFGECDLLTSIIIDNNETNLIGMGAFSGCKRLTNFTIPNSVCGIGFGAFQYCTGLESIIIPNSVKGIPQAAFSGCSGLTSVTIGNNVTFIGYRAFSGCNNLRSIIIPNSVTSIRNGAFFGCNSLESITLPFVGNGGDDEEEIASTHFGYIFGASSFSENSKFVPTSLKTVVILGGDSIGDNAFNGCSSLTSVTIPDSVTSIGISAFDDCSGLTGITIPFVGASKDGTSNTHFGYIFGASSAQGSLNYSDFENGNADKVPASLKTVIITSSTNLGDYAFYNCSELTSITIPDSVISIGKSAFYNCSELTSITIPDSVTSIGKSAFYNCNSLTSISIPNSVTSIGYGVFHDCSGLTSITIPDSVTSIGDCAFYNCNSLTSISISNNVTSIGYGVFYNCSELTSITIPDSVTSIGKSAFYNCNSLTSISIPNSVTSIGDSALANCSGLESITLPFVGASKNGTSNTHFGYIFGASNYSDNSSRVPSSLKMVIIAGGASLGDNAFRGCSSLTSITIPDDVTSIGSNAFYGCSSLISIEIPNNLTRIIMGVFSDCIGLKSITIPDSVTSIGQYAFSGCSELTSITIPDSVTDIGNSAFYNCNSLTSISIPNSVTRIGEYAFYGCSSLINIEIPNSVMNIGSYVFGGCSKLQYNEYGNSYYLGNDTNKYVALIKAKDASIISCTIHEYTRFIYGSAFYNCSSLTSITIPNSVTSIGYLAFNGCPIETVTMPASAISYIPKNALKTVVITSGTSLEDYAFDHCSSLTSIMIPDGVTRIGEYAFYGCSSLISIEIPNSVMSIGNYAFGKCSSLTSVTFQNANGWQVSKNSDISSATSLSSTDISNSSTAATYLITTYCNYYWKRS